MNLTDELVDSLPGQGDADGFYILSLSPLKLLSYDLYKCVFATNQWSRPRVPGKGWYLECDHFFPVREG